MRTDLKQEELNELLNSLPEEGLEGIQLEDLCFDTTNVINFLATDALLQSTKSNIYKLFKKLLIAKYAVHFENHKTIDEILGIRIDFPYISLGNINSRHFFGIDELLIYDFYKRNKNKYTRVCDIGANCGLHSKILCQLGYKVDSFEPDDTHAKFFKNYLNNSPNNDFYQKAVSAYTGKANFTRIINNSTGSYINDKKESYGPIDQYEVDVIDAKGLSNKYDLIKMDIEGSEADVLEALDISTFEKTDIIAEVSTTKTRVILWNLFVQNNLTVYSQKTGWGKVKTIEDLPTSHREGSIFISKFNNWID